MGAFCGRFQDELQDDEDDEHEDMDGEKRKTRASTMTYHKKKPKSRAKAAHKPEGRGTSTAALKWAQYLAPINVKAKDRGVMTKAAQLRVVNNTNLTQGMLRSISQLSNVHTIEIIRCQREEIPPFLNELEGLAVLRMSHNNLRKFSDDLAKCTRLEQIIFDWNSIGGISPNIFSLSPACFPSLEVINISHNSLSVLPEDFGMTSKASIKHIDLSHNQLRSIPASICCCKRLEELNLSHNKLKALPNKFAFKKLRTLFLSFNELTRLPPDIGQCEQLRKIRFVSNQVRELPESIILLWKKHPKKPGNLEEIRVESNPLVMPSITAFVMEGHDRAFGLLLEHLEELKHAAAQKKPALALENQEAAPLAIDGGQASPAAPQPALQDAPDDGDGREAVKDPGLAASHEYYFGHCNGDSAAIHEIRNAESQLLINKRNLFFLTRSALAKELMEEDPTQVPAEMKEFLNEDYGDRYTGPIPVSEVDIQFCLLVQDLKAMFSSIDVLFKKHASSGRSTMTRDEWDDLVLRSAAYLKPEMTTQMWNSMIFRRDDQISKVQLVAACHVHDIEARDPWIVRVAEVLRLEYYSMTLADLQTRIRAEARHDAQGDFDPQSLVRPRGEAHHGRDEDSDDSPTEDALQNTEGLRMVRHSVLEQDETPSRGRAQGAEEGAPNAGRTLVLKELPKISLTDAQYEAHLADADDRSEGDASDNSLKSQELSEEEEEDSDDSEFDAQLYMLQRDETPGQNINGATEAGKFTIDSDEAIRRLMEVPPEEFFKKKDMIEKKQAAAVLQPAGKQLREGQWSQDRNLKNDIFAIRQALRSLYRNMPDFEFRSLINFLLRGMLMIKHHLGEPHTCWHSDSPTFMQAMGVKKKNKYTRQLLAQLGFVHLKDIYWIWPSAHLNQERRAGVITWGEAAVPHNCPGMDRQRLDDMIDLLKSCQMKLHKSGASFTGHFELLR